MQNVWKEIIEFNNKYFPEWKERDLIYISNALAGETGEICNKVKKYMGGGTNKEVVTLDMLALEGSDIFIYLALFFEMIGADYNDFCENIRAKLKILVKRMENECKK